MIDLIHDVAVVHLKDATDITNHTDIGSNYVDMAGFNSAMFLVNIGALTNQDANNCVIPILQECDAAPATNGSWGACAAADIIGSTFAVVNSAATDQLTQKAAYRGAARYLRVLLDFTSAGANPDHCPCSIDAIMFAARHGPASGVTPTSGTSTA